MALLLDSHFIPLTFILNISLYQGYMIVVVSKSLFLTLNNLCPYSFEMHFLNTIQCKHHCMLKSCIFKFLSISGKLFRRIQSVHVFTHTYISYSDTVIDYSRQYTLIVSEEKLAKFINFV